VQPRQERQRREKHLQLWREQHLQLRLVAFRPSELSPQGGSLQCPLRLPRAKQPLAHLRDSQDRPSARGKLHPPLVLPRLRPQANLALLPQADPAPLPPQAPRALLPRDQALARHPPHALALAPCTPPRARRAATVSAPRR
jgi:hypothetical protein